MPVFPPREDVQVGDIHALSSDQKACGSMPGGYMPIGQWVGRIDCSQLLDDQYANRTSFPPGSGFSVPNAGAAPEFPTEPSSATGFKTYDHTRQRLVGFPAFMSASVSQGDISGIIPAEAMSIGAAAGFSFEKAVTVSVPYAEYHGMPTTVALGQVMDATGHLVRKSNQFDPQMLPLVLNSDAKPEKSLGYVRLITEVYSTRVIDVSIRSSRAAGVAVKATPIDAGALGRAPVEGGQASAAVPSSQPSTNIPATPPTVPAEPTAQSQLAQMNEQLDSAMAGLSPGVKAKFVAAGQYGVSLRTTFERPIVIGYRGLLLHVVVDADGKSFKIAGASALTTFTPTGGGDQLPIGTAPSPAPGSSGGNNEGRRPGER